MKILIVEDDGRVADFMQRGLRSSGMAVGVAEDGESALAQLARERFDVVVLDLMLPGIGGQEVCQQMRARGDTTPVLMLSALDGVKDRVSGLECGADDYLTKPFDFGELLARLRSLMRRNQMREAQAKATDELRQGAITFNLRSLEASSHGKPVLLTTKERGILQMLLESPGTVISREHLLNVVWGTIENTGTNIVDVYIARLRGKLGEAGRDIETIRGAGYRLRRSPG